MLRIISITLNILFLMAIGLYLAWPRILARYHLSDDVGCWSDVIKYGPYSIQMRKALHHENDFVFTRFLRGNTVVLSVENEDNCKFVTPRKQGCLAEPVQTGFLLANNIMLSWQYDDDGRCIFAALRCNGRSVFFGTSDNMFGSNTQDVTNSVHACEVHEEVK